MPLTYRSEPFAVVIIPTSASCQ